MMDGTCGACPSQPPPKSRWIAPTQKHINLKEEQPLHTSSSATHPPGSSIPNTQVRTPLPFVIATPRYGINTVPTPTVAITRAWLAHDTYNYRHTRERMHGMSAP